MLRHSQMTRSTLNLVAHYHTLESIHPELLLSVFCMGRGKEPPRIQPSRTEALHTWVRFGASAAAAAVRATRGQSMKVRS